MREDLPRAKVEQELEALRYQTYIQQQLVRFASFKNISSEMSLFSEIHFLFLHFFVKGRERCACREADCAFSRARGETERARIARNDEITAEIGR